MTDALSLDFSPPDGRLSAFGLASGSACFTVKIRRTLGKEVRPEAEQIDGKTYRFRYGWTMDDGDPYAGEIAALPDDPNYPKDAPHWIAMGDLSPNIGHEPRAGESPSMPSAE